MGIFISLRSLGTIRRESDQYTGLPIAVAGLALSAFFLISGVGYGFYVYHTEVPEGYERISFLELQPDPARPDLPVSARALALDGQKVFVKGYIYPGDRRENLKQFVLVPDMKTCCFGGQPKLTHMVEVTLEDPERAEYSMRKRKLGGILKVDTSLKPVSGVRGVYFQLAADYLK